MFNAITYNINSLFIFLIPLFSHRSLPDALSTSPNPLREDIKRLKLIELQLKDEVKSLAHHRDGLVMELQQLQEAKPVLEKAYAVSVKFSCIGIRTVLLIIDFPLTSIENTTPKSYSKNPAAGG